MGHEITVISPDLFNGFPCPTYPEIKLAWMPRRKIARTLREFRPQAIHIATEGPLGHAARGYCQAHNLPFTTAYHTRFPEYVQARFSVPVGLSYAWLRRFHGTARSVMVATPSIEEDPRLARFRQHPPLVPRRRHGDVPPPRQRPARFAAGRFTSSLAASPSRRTSRAFLELDLPGSQAVIGDGPQLEQLKRKFPKTHFLGRKVGEDLARHYAAADVFVFPSLTDTFGLVILEAMASGVPVAAFPVPGPKDIITDENHGAGALDSDLGRAIARALAMPAQRCREIAEQFSWRAATEQFFNTSPRSPPSISAGNG